MCDKFVLSEWANSVQIFRSSVSYYIYQTHVAWGTIAQVLCYKTPVVGRELVLGLVMASQASSS